MIMFDYLLSEEAVKIRDEARDLVKWVPRQMILDMDNDKIRFPTEFLREAGRRNLMGCRYPKEWGGRGLDWVTTCAVMEEIGTLGYIFACTFGVGAELVCDAIILHGTDAQKEKYVKPLLKGDMFAAECLTEPRGGSDFFGTSTTAEDKGDHFLVNGQKRFIVGAEGADFFLVYAKTDPDAEPHKALTCLIVDKGPGWRSNTFTGSWDAGAAGPGVWSSKMCGCPRKTWWARSTGLMPSSRP
jgi:butyryl-CoA dehydrogenase